MARVVRRVFDLLPQLGDVHVHGARDWEAAVAPDGVEQLIACNCDNGDAWEWIDEPRYPLKFGLAAYRIGMNAIVYAMTH